MTTAPVALPAWLADRWSPRLTGILALVYVVGVTAAGAGSHATYGLAWAACCALAAWPADQDAVDPLEPGLAGLRQHLQRAFGGAGLAAMLVGPWLVFQEDFDRRRFLWGLHGLELLGYAALFGAAAGPVLLAAYRRGPATRARAVGRGLAVTALLGLWAVVAVVELAYVDAISRGFEKAWRAALERLSAPARGWGPPGLADEPLPTVALALAIAVPFGVAAFSTAARLPLGRSLCALLLGGWAWSSLLLDLGGGDAPHLGRLQACTIGLAALLLAVDAPRPVSAPAPP